MKSIRTSPDFSLQLTELWDVTPPGEGQPLLHRCAGGKEASVMMGCILDRTTVYQAERWLLDIFPIGLKGLEP